MRRSTDNTTRATRTSAAGFSYSANDYNEFDHDKRGYDELIPLQPSPAGTLEWYQSNDQIERRRWSLGDISVCILPSQDHQEAANDPRTKVLLHLHQHKSKNVTTKA